MRDASWFGHPRGLTILFLTSMWEQFSYFGMRALLVYYMTRELMLGQGASSLIYGAYTSTAYFTPLIGGLIADRVLGKRRAIIIGASIMAIGHFMMTFEGLFIPALVTIALGNGLFLPSLPSQINDLYDEDDPRRASAFNVYYVGINVGALLAPLACGALGEIYGWHSGFAAAGAGMLTGLLVYLLGGRYLPATQPPATKAASVKPSRMTRQAALLLAAIALSVTVFRAAYEQIGNTLALWIGTNVDRHAGSLVVPMTWFQALDPLYVIVFTQPLLAIWQRRADAGVRPRLVRRMAIGALIVAAAYVLLGALSAFAGHGMVDWPWVVVFVAMFTLGELFILPTGLAVFAELAPPGLGSTIIAAWFLTIFSGSLLAGLVGTLWSRIGHSHFFALLALLATFAALMLRALDRRVRRSERAEMTTASSEAT